ncbi:MAG: DNA cytosine methyltransferase [Candidatus Methylumidiphilus sp.]
MSKLTAVSLFCGAGGMDVGFKKAGFNVVAANELDAYACNTYAANHPEAALFRGDINLLRDGLAIYNGVDLVFGGPPCQGFSVAGKMDADDPRSKLVFAFAGVVESLKPSSFVMENVKALGVLSKFEPIRKDLFRRFHTLGYSVTVIILNAKDYGAAQARERVFFIGVRSSYPAIKAGMFNQYKKKAVSLRQAISPLGLAGSKSNSRVCNAKITLATNPVLRKSPYAGMLFNGQGRPINPDGWSSTLPASMGGNRTPIIDECHLFENKEGWVEKYHAYLMAGGQPMKFGDVPQQLRRLTIDEAALLQCFPSNYNFIGPQSKVYSQIGNAVPCNLAFAVGQVVYGALTNSEIFHASYQPQRGEMLELNL